MYSANHARSSTCDCSLDGINRIIGGAKISEYLTVQEFIGNIVKEGIADGVLSNNSYTRSLLETL